MAADSTRTEAMSACIDHASDLIESARAVQSLGHHNIAYHLGVLALEELGRRELLGLQSITEKLSVPPAWVQKYTLSHTKKLFWCFFGANFFSEILTKDVMLSIDNFARSVHQKRVAGLYVGYEDDELSIPSDAIAHDETETIIGLAHARIEISKNNRQRDRIPDDELELQSWFFAASEDIGKQRFIMSSHSMQKLFEYKNAKKWVLWLKEEFDRIEAEGRAAAEDELKRSKTLPLVGTKDKWKIVIRILTLSHSIRPKTLTYWNNKVEWIKLRDGGKKDQILVEFVLKDRIPVESLWLTGWWMARQFVVALNIGTMGHWWWHFPQYVDTYYENIQDLERKARFKLTRTPSLKIDWGSNRVFSESDVDNVIACLVSMGIPIKNELITIFNYYMGGLNFLSLNDVHWQCEAQAFIYFYRSLKEMMNAFGRWDQSGPYLPTLHKFLIEVLHEGDDIKLLEKLFHAYETNNMDSAVVTLREASSLKIVCDTFYLKTQKENFLKNRKSEM